MPGAERFSVPVAGPARGDYQDGVRTVRIALLADVHGNTVALDAALEAVALRDVDAAVFLGDLAAGGPDPAGAVERIAAMDAVSVRGNTDDDLVRPPAWWADPAAAGMSAGAQRLGAICSWGAGQLTVEHTRYLDTLPTTAKVPLGRAGRLLAFHGSPTGLRDVLTPTTPEQEVSAALGDASHEFLVGGHSPTYASSPPVAGDHQPGQRRGPFSSYGSSGDVSVDTHAAFALLEVLGDEWSVEFRQIAVDTELMRHQATQSEMPHADWWLALRGLEPGPPHE